jgi:acyl-CoA synthetase (AMP-forming)/AMP-acid ligase II/acyl carrier protein
VAFLTWCQATFPSELLSGVLAGTSICFDLSIFEIFATLSCGGTIVMAENLLDYDALHSWPVTTLNTVPSVLTELLSISELPETVRLINLAGEALPRDLVDSLYNRGIESVMNLYGPTEDTTYSTFALIEKNSHYVSIGGPIGNTEARIVDGELVEVGIGVIGDLYLGGAGLARGYLGRAEITAERFVPNPYGGAGTRLYRTGDVARWRADGAIEFLGRRDHQVKVRGYRIELGEVEAALREQAEVSEAVVVAWESSSGEKKLVGYVVGAAGEELNVVRVREQLRRELPDYMVPSVLVPLERMPLNANGKVDRKRLPEPEVGFAQRGGEYEAPRTAVEEIMAGIWEEVLGVERVGVKENFFELGGHSLLATRVVSYLRNTLGVQLPVRRLFENPTISDLAAILEKEDEQAETRAELFLKLSLLSDEQAEGLLETQPSQLKGQLN